MELLLIPFVAGVASLLTFFSGFGLGTILTPVFVIFFPIDLAIALTAIVHLLNNLFKLALVGKFADRSAVLRFGIPALIAAAVGASLLSLLTDQSPVLRYTMFARQFEITWIKLVIAVLMIFFTLFEILPYLKNLHFGRRYLVLGGLLSGFFGGLSGHQGALRSAFLVRLNLSKESFIATGVVIACSIDLIRLVFYAKHFSWTDIQNNSALLFFSVMAAFAGALAGSRLLKKITMDSVQKTVALFLLILAIALGFGIV